MEFDRYWHMAGIFRAAAKPSLVWGTADLQIIGGKNTRQNLTGPRYNDYRCQSVYGRPLL